MKHQIKHRYTDAVLFECDVPEDVQASGMATRYALEKAVKDGANLSGADLTGSNLTGSNLYCSNLTGSNLTGSNLTGSILYCSNLTGSNLTGSNLAGSNLYCSNLTGSNLTGSILRGAHLRGADLRGANLGAEEKLIGDRPVFMVGPIGTRCDYLTAYLTDKGIHLRAGCFFGDVDTFRAKLEETHGDSDYAAEYQAALALIEKHAEIWTPKEEA